jgi:hypothetical protein
MKITIKVIFLFLLITNTGFSQDSLCTHSTDGNAKAKGLKISLSYACDWVKMESNSADQIFKFLKKDDELKILTAISIDIANLPDRLSLSEAKEFLKPEVLTDGTGTILSSKSSTVDKISGSQIIRKDTKNNFYRIFNYFFYKNKLVSITYSAIFGSEVNVKDYFALFDTFLSKSKFK